MAWNEPGGSRDPWGGRNDQQAPPDIDEALRNLQSKLQGIFGGSGGGDNSGGTGGSGNSSLILLLIAIALPVIWAVNAAYTVDAREQAVVTRFGQYQDTVGAGFHFHWWPVERVQKVNVTDIRTVQRKGLMLTKDENIVDISLSAQYNVKDAANYLFRVTDPDAVLAEVSESAIRAAIGRNDMDYVLTEGRGEVVELTRGILQEVLDEYETGLNVTSVNLQQAQPPEQVQGAFADAIKAREDKQRFINEAEAYRNEIIPQARGNARKMIEDAIAYRARATEAAKGEAERFEQLLAEYQKAPDVTRERLYIETVESVMSKSTKVMVDTRSNNLLMLPLDRLLSGETTSSELTDSSGSPSFTDSPTNDTGDLRRNRSNMRDREVRQ